MLDVVAFEKALYASTKEKPMYEYKDLRSKLFTEDGCVMFTSVRDHVKKVIKVSGAITMGCAMQGAGGGDTWTMMACVDRLVELGELREVTQGYVAGQDRVFVLAS